VVDSAPTITVLAGTNGAGESSIGGAQLEAARAPFYNPDAETRELMAANPAMTLDEANAAAWGIGKERLEAAQLLAQIDADRSVPKAKRAKAKSSSNLLG